MVKIKTENLAELVLPLLKKKSQPLSFLSKKLKVDFGDIASAIKLLKEWGYRIQVKKDNVTLQSIPDKLLDLEISHNLKTKTIGKKIHTYQRVKSTNDIAGQLAESGEPEGTVVVADEQSGGRGRLGRYWHSPPRCGIYVSIILKPKFKPEKAPGVSIMTAVAIADAIDKIIPDKVRIKWPNDILLNGKKTAGILTELSSEKNKVNHIIVGVGININNKADDFPDELKDMTTSLRIARKRKINRVEFLQAFLVNFEKEYKSYKKQQLKPVLKKIKRFSSLIGSEITLQDNRSIIRGKAIDIDSSGGLVIDTDGVKKVITSGEVTVVKN